MVRHTRQSCRWRREVGWDHGAHCRQGLIGKQGKGTQVGEIKKWRRTRKKKKKTDLAVAGLALCSSTTALGTGAACLITWAGTCCWTGGGAIGPGLEVAPATATVTAVTVCAAPVIVLGEPKLHPRPRSTPRNTFRVGYLLTRVGIRLVGGEWDGVSDASKVSRTNLFSGGGSTGPVQEVPVLVCT